MSTITWSGGLGTRKNEENHLSPKTLINIAGNTIILNILKIYNSYSINKFIIYFSYKGYMIKKYFANYFLHTYDVIFHLYQGHYIKI